MTVPEMRDRIVARVLADDKGTSMSELVDACGPEAHGDLSLELLDNLVLWAGVSGQFSDAFSQVQDQIRMAILPPLLVHTEPKRLRLPVARRVRPYKTPRWLPVALLPASVPEAAAPSRPFAPA